MFNLSEESLKSKPISAPWPKGLLIFFIVLFLLVLGINFILRFYLLIQEKKADSLNQELETLRSSLAKEEEDKILRLEKKIEGLNILLGNHTAFSSFFDWLEKHTHPNIYYLSLEYSLDSLKVSLNGISKDNLSVAQGIEGGLIEEAINSPKLIDGIVLRNLEQTKENQTKFSLDIYLKLSGLLFKPQENITQ